VLSPGRRQRGEEEDGERERCETVHGYGFLVTRGRRS
jgi:hypothetical protein